MTTYTASIIPNITCQAQSSPKQLNFNYVKAFVDHWNRTNPFGIVLDSTHLWTYFNQLYQVSSSYQVSLVPSNQIHLVQPTLLPLIQNNPNNNIINIISNNNDYNNSINTNTNTYSAEIAEAMNQKTNCSNLRNILPTIKEEENEFGLHLDPSAPIFLPTSVTTSSAPNTPNNPHSPQLHASISSPSPFASPNISPLSSSCPNTPTFSIPTASPSSSPISSPIANQKDEMMKPKGSTCTKQVIPPKYISRQLFQPCYPARAALNIYVPHQTTQDLLPLIKEYFPDHERLYYYIDITTALQINDRQMNIFEIEINGRRRCVVLANYDIHDRQTGDTLYGIITANDRHPSKNSKWLWKMDRFWTAAQIFKVYGISRQYLPTSSRSLPEFKRQLQIQEKCIVNIRADIVEETDWCNVQQIKNLRRKGNKKNKEIQIVVKLNKRKWIEQCRKSWRQFDAIPIVVNENKNHQNSHWIEWIKLIRAEQDNDQSYIGVSCRYCQRLNQWRITSICLDKGDIENKHRLVGSAVYNKPYVQYFDYFNTTYTEIQWIRTRE